MFVPSIDPLRKNIAGFQAEYNRFIVVIGCFLLICPRTFRVLESGLQIQPFQHDDPGLDVSFSLSAQSLKKPKETSFIGIRTPWTLSSDSVWDKTHQLGGKLFKISGLLALGGFIFPDSRSIFFLLIPLLGSSLFLVLYIPIYFSEKRPPPV